MENKEPLDNYEYKPPVFELSKSTKLEYLRSLIGKICKILHIAEEGEYSPKSFIGGQMFEVNAANSMFDNKLAIVIIKLKGLYDNCDTMDVAEIRKQVNEIKKFINHMIKDLEEGD